MVSESEKSAAEKQQSAAAQQSRAQQHSRQTAAAVCRGRVAGCGGIGRSRQSSRSGCVPGPTKTPQQKLQELQSMYNQGLISESDYNAAKAKILNQLDAVKSDWRPDHSGLRRDREEACSTAFRR